jgi:hypothetical protein
VFRLAATQIGEARGATSKILASYGSDGLPKLLGPVWQALRR